MELLKEDLAWCVSRLPKALKDQMKDRGSSLIVAGGFVRSCISREEINDVDVFSNSKDTALLCAVLLGDETSSKSYKSDNAITVKTKPFPVQYIHRWVYSDPMDVIHSFDFTIAKAAFWFDKPDNKWVSFVDDRFYPDLAAKRLVYTMPIRNEEAGGSFLRVLKFYQRGYRIPLDSAGAVIARLVKNVRMEECEEERKLARVLTGLLVEVDPNIDPLHVSHLPSTKENLPE